MFALGLGIVQFLWPHGGKKVEVVGSFEGSPLAMKPSIVEDGTFYLDLACPQGTIEFR